MQINQTNLIDLYKGFRALFMGMLTSTETTWQKIAMRTTSNALQEVYGWLGAWPKMKEFLGEATIKNLAANTFSIKNKEFEATVAIKQLDI
jgi:phage major head subunit gpT-like protein